MKQQTNEIIKKLLNRYIVKTVKHIAEKPGYMEVRYSLCRYNISICFIERIKEFKLGEDEVKLLESWSYSEEVNRLEIENGVGNPPI